MMYNKFSWKKLHSRKEAESMGVTKNVLNVVVVGQCFKEDVDYRELQKWQGCAST